MVILVYKIMMFIVSVTGELSNYWFRTAKIKKSKVIIQIFHGKYHNKSSLGLKPSDWLLAFC